MERHETTASLHISPTTTPTPIAIIGSSYGWIAAPVLLTTMLLALSTAIFICVLTRKINRKTVRVQPQSQAELGRDLENGVWYVNRDILAVEPEMNEDIQDVYPEESAHNHLGMATGLTYDKVEDISAMYAFELQSDNDIVVLRVPPSYPQDNSKSQGAPHHPNTAGRAADLYSYERLWSPEDNSPLL